MITLITISQLFIVCIAIDIQIRHKENLKLPQTNQMFHIISKIKAEESVGNFLNVTIPHNNPNEETYY